MYRFEQPLFSEDPAGNAPERSLEQPRASQHSLDQEVRALFNEKKERASADSQKAGAILERLKMPVAESAESVSSQKEGVALESIHLKPADTSG
ncbi:MAG: hypothetical protein WDN67_00355 [Candidatus Moraniibacteriota bacterium]